MSLFLNAAEGEASQLGWMRTASFKLTVVNHQDPKKTIRKGEGRVGLVRRPVQTAPCRCGSQHGRQDVRSLCRQ